MPNDSPSLSAVSLLSSPSSPNPAATSSSLNLQLDSSEGLPRQAWIEKGAATRILLPDPNNPDPRAPTVIRRSVEDFRFGKELGEGSYSTVSLATDIHTNINYAVKILDKRHIVKERKVKYVNIEKHALNRLNRHPGIISLHFTFQDKHSLYFVLDYASNGELLGLIKRYKTLNEDCVCYFGAQILDAIGYMHLNGIVHRDIKPENILLSPSMRIKITDFGTACLLQKGDEDEDYPIDVRAKSFVGTAEYVSPELLDSKYCGKPGDIWAFGCIMYQLVAGKPPFRGSNEYLTFQKITKLQYAFSAGFPTILRDLVRRILVLQPLRRLTIPDIAKHHFFHKINMLDPDAIWNTDPPPLAPYKMSAKAMQKFPASDAAPPPPLLLLRQKSPAPTLPNPNQRLPSERAKNDAAALASHILSKSQSLQLLASPTLVSATNNTSSVTTHTSTSNGGGRRNSAHDPSAEYIPGTNILRPKINLRTITRSYSAAKPKNLSLNAPAPEQPLAIASSGTAEMTWQHVLTHPDERVLKAGCVLMHKEQLDAFERKHRGALVELPLGYGRVSSTSSQRSSSSVLSNMAGGGTGGLRGRAGSASGNNSSNNEENSVPPTENDTGIVFEYRVPIPSDADYGDGEGPPGTGKIVKAFRRLRNPLVKDLEVSIGLPILQSPSPSATHFGSPSLDSGPYYKLDKPLECILVVTTHGRALFCAIHPTEPNPRLLLELRLVHPIVRFRELVLSTPGRFQRSALDRGTFAILTLQNAIVCDTDKSEIATWTQTLANSKINQARRLVYMTNDVENSPPNDVENSQSPIKRTLSRPQIKPKPPSLSPNNYPAQRAQLLPSYPQTLDPTRTDISDSLASLPSSAVLNRGKVPSPIISSDNGATVSQHARRADMSPISPSEHASPDLLKGSDRNNAPRTQVRVRRIKPELPVMQASSQGSILHNDMLQAAKLAVAHGSVSDRENRSSFSKERLSSRQGEAPRVMVTTKTSKLLARSRAA